MTVITCDQIRALALDPAGAPADWVSRPDIDAHLNQCADCRDWVGAFSTGLRSWAALPADAFTDDVLARTSGVEAVLRDLPLLAELDPGPGFADRVLLATSRKPAPEGWRARAAAAWAVLVGRPRFAWEAAYVATVCWVLVFGNPVGAIEWGATNLSAAARERLGPPAQELRTDIESWRGRLATSPSAVAPPAANAPEPAPPIVRAWQAASDWLRRITDSMAGALWAEWRRVAAALGIASDEAAPPTEPRSEPVRSPK